MRTARSLEFLCSKSLVSRSLAFLSAHELSPEAPASKSDKGEVKESKGKKGEEGEERKEEEYRHISP